MTNPTLTLQLEEADPKFNPETDDYNKDFKKMFNIKVEVMSLNFNNNEMTVKYHWPSLTNRDGTLGTVIRAVKADPFFEQYELSVRSLILYPRPNKQKPFLGPRTMD